jgi:carbonic anhydrase
VACHVQATVEQVKAFSFVETEGLQIVGAVFDIASGEVIFLD